MSQEFLHQLHATYKTPAYVLSSLVKDATGQELRDHAQIVRGYANEVYRVWTHFRVATPTPAQRPSKACVQPCAPGKANMPASNSAARLSELR